MLSKTLRSLAILGIAAIPLQAMAATINLGTAGAFAVLAGSTVTNTGPSVVDGDLGLSPGTSVTGFPPGTLVGTMHVADGVALQAQNDLTTAYNVAAGEAVTQDLTGQDLGGLTLTPGTYFFSSTAGLTGTLKLDHQGNPSAQFVFQIGSGLTTASNSSVVSINNGGAVGGCNVFWQIGSSAVLGTGTDFQGHIMALESITMNTGSSILYGSALARTGAVTLDSVTITACPEDTGPPTHPVPLPNAALAGLTLLSILGLTRLNSARSKKSSAQ